MGPIKKIKRLVLDSGAFLKNVPIWDYGEEFFSVNNVYDEMKDKNAKQFIRSLPVEIKWRDPEPASIEFINEFTKQIGEFRCLSLADVKVLALTYELEKEAKGGTDHLRTKPEPKRVESASKPPLPSKTKSASSNQDEIREEESEVFLNVVPGLEIEDYKLDVPSETQATEAVSSHVPSVTEAVSSNVPSVTEAVSSDVPSLTEAVSSDVPSLTEATEAVSSLNISEQSCNKDENAEDNERIDDDADDDNEGWITPSNINAIKNKHNSLSEEDYKNVEVACMTCDFAVQNTLLHMGLSTVGVDGRLIKSLRMYILRCFVCRTLCSNVEMLFCNKCGYKTLKKVPYTLKQDGTKHIWESKRPINIKGMKYSLPKPQGGKHGENPILCADQRVPQMRPKKRNIQRNNPMGDDYIVRAADQPFLPTDVSSISGKLGVKYGFTNKASTHRGTYYWERRNPNDPGRNVKSRRKS